MKSPSSAERNTNKPSRPGSDHRNSSPPRGNWRTPSAIWSAEGCCNTMAVPSGMTCIPSSAASLLAGSGPRKRDDYGQRVVDHFSSQAHSPYDEAETLEDVRDGLHIVRTLLKMGRFQQASMPTAAICLMPSFSIWKPTRRCLSLLRPFFPEGWDTLPNAVDESDGSYLASCAAIALRVD